MTTSGTGLVDDAQVASDVLLLGAAGNSSRHKRRQARWGD